jgi:hypothetical protein
MKHIDSSMLKVNPFSARVLDGETAETFWVDADSRIRLVKTFGFEQCEAALKVPDLQKTVRVAVERRLRMLRRHAHRVVQEILGY